MKPLQILRLATAVSLIASQPLLAQKVEIPHAQDKPPGPALSPDEAIAKMTVPEGFSVECVASEPNIVNPVAMTIDERGRFWITESLEYPRKEAGPGRDRVKVLEDTDGDGKADRFTIFLDGLNIPSGVAVGHGGVWIANSPDILFVPDADRDLQPDGPPQVVVTGFGRHDTHELPNSLTWGPDGWLYGLNGVFNFSHVTYPPDSPWLKHIKASGGRQSPEKSQNDENVQPNELGGLTPPARLEFTFTCAMFRIHPRTREFQVFAEGTSNPWGIAFNDEGEAFVSACVIDHLWHIVETGYYHRQGGPYPPFTWKIDSIVKHKHQKAAYCGIHYFDSDAYPEQYRGKLYMGNIHGGCINVDKLQRDGSTYFATGEPDFLTANDAWFMPVVQKTGPDGCLYILDWYDRYHCYQDANRDPAGIDRLKGRLYRVRHNGKQSDATKPKTKPGEPEGVSPRTTPKVESATNPKPSAGLRPAARLYPDINLAKETDEQLIERLGANNDFIRWTATRLLQERNADSTRQRLLATFADARTSRIQQRHALFSLAGLPPSAAVSDIGDVASAMTNLPNEGRLPRDWVMMHAWLNRMGRNDSKFHAQRAGLPIVAAANRQSDEPLHPRLSLEEVISISKLPSKSPEIIDGLLFALSKSGRDPLLPRVIWQNLHPRLEDHAVDFVVLIEKFNYLKAKPVADLMPRVAERILGRQKFDAQPIAKLFALLRDDHPQVGRQVLEIISAKVQSGELKGEKLDQLKAALAEPLTPLLRGVGFQPADHPLSTDAALLSVSWGDPRGLPHVRRSFATAGLQSDLRLKALNSLIAAKDDGLLEVIAKVLDDLSGTALAAGQTASPVASAIPLKSQILSALGRLDEPKVAEMVLARYSTLEPELQPSAIELLTQRANWSKQLLSRVADKKIAATAINVNQARRIQALKDKDLSDLLSRHWGQVRDTRNPDREKVVAEMKSLIRQQPGDPFAGEKVFKRVCAACHKIYGEGPDIGPDITSNGRNDFNQLLSNVFDPSLVIGAGYRVCTVVNKAGRVQSGLLIEDSPQRVVLKPAAVAPSGTGFQPVDQPKKGKNPKDTKKKEDRLEAFPTVTVAVGNLETIPRDDIDEFKINELSLMPEGLEKQLTPQEITDLFAFLTLDKHPSDKTAKRLPGVTAVTPRDSTNLAEFPSLIAEVLPGFTTTASGELGLVNQAIDWSYEFGYWGAARIVSE